MKHAGLLALSVLLFYIPHVSAKSAAVDTCVKPPKFLKTLKIGKRPAISTHHQLSRWIGPVIRDMDSTRVYQHPSWRSTGTAGAFTRDSDGNIYVLPSVTVNLEYNKPDAQNTIYRIDTATGLMTAYLQIPSDYPLTSGNPFGVMGLTYDCETDSLYVSSLAGSDAYTQRGQILQIDRKSAKIKSRLTGFDTLGLGILRIGNEKRLYFGEARSSDVYSVALTESGGLADNLQPRFEVSVDDLKGGDSLSIKKIVFRNRTGNTLMQLEAMEFGYRPTAQTGIQVKNYQLRFDSKSGKWEQQLR